MVGALGASFLIVLCPVMVEQKSEREFAIVHLLIQRAFLVTLLKPQNMRPAIQKNVPVGICLKMAIEKNFYLRLEYYFHLSFHFFFFAFSLFTFTKAVWKYITLSTLN